MRQPNSGRFQKKTSAGASNNGRVDGASVCVSGFGGLQVACWPLVPKFTGSHLTKAAGLLGQKIPQQAFFRRGSKDVGHMS